MAKPDCSPENQATAMKNYIPTSRDKEIADEMLDHLRHAEDLAHWLHVHRRQKLAEHIENGIKMTKRMTYDLQGQMTRARAENGAKS